MKNNFTVVIPARIDSSRLPKKPLLKIGNKSLIQRVCELAEKVNPTRIIVATDSKKIKAHVEDIGYESILTSSKHRSGLDRINEVANKLHFDEDEPILNIQGDEPFVPINMIQTVGESINKGSDICTASCKFANDEEVINLANDTPYGLASYFYSRDISRVWKIAEALEYGIVSINNGLPTIAEIPFGGVKESGMGREGSKYGLDDYLVIKYISMGGI